MGLSISREQHPASPSVFISSTVKEFRDLRSAIAYTLRTQGYIVYLSEAADFDIRGDRSAIEECFENIRNCDYYILIIGGVRGNLFNEDTSITRQEYRVARDSYLSKGRPLINLFLRESIENALQSTPEAQSKAAIDYPDHLNSFISEVQQPPAEGTPNYLTRFRDFEDVIRSMATRLSLGRTFSEHLLRHSLSYELLSNLTHIVSRERTSAFPRHHYMWRTRAEIEISPKELDKTVKLSGDNVTSLVFALVGRTTSNELHIVRIEEAIRQGLFLRYNTATASFEETAVHKALQQILTDIKALRRLDNYPINNTRWDLNILDAATPQRRGPENILLVKGWDLASALSYYDRVENIYNGHIAVCKVLLGISEELEPYQLTPITPVGEQEEQKICSHAISAEEIAYLFRNDISPFGNRVPRDIFGTNREKQIKTIIEGMQNTITEAGINPDILTPDMLQSIAEKYIDDYTALPEEGIKEIRPD